MQQVQQLHDSLRQVKQNINQINSRINQLSQRIAQDQRQLSTITQQHQAHLNEIQQITQSFNQFYQQIDNTEKLTQSLQNSLQVSQYNVPGQTTLSGTTSQYQPSMTGGGFSGGYDRQFSSSQYAPQPASQYRSRNVRDEDVGSAYYNNMGTTSQYQPGRFATQQQPLYY